MTEEKYLADMPYRDRTELLLTHQHINEDPDHGKVNDMIQDDAKKECERQDKDSGALDGGERIPKEDRYRPRNFSAKQRDKAFEECPDIPDSDGKEKMDITGRTITNQDKARNVETDHEWAHSRGGKTIQENARSLERNANRQRKDTPLSPQHDKLWRPDYDS